jgi:hypothetical protein
MMAASTFINLGGVPGTDAIYTAAMLRELVRGRPHATASIQASPERSVATRLPICNDHASIAKPW